MPGVSKNSSKPLDAGDVVMSLQGRLDGEDWLAAANKAGAAAGPDTEIQHPATPLLHGRSRGRNVRANDCIVYV